jgi:hypoxanthine phosphoribosyltransferase
VTDKKACLAPALPPGARRLLGAEDIRCAVNTLGLAIRDCYGQRELTVVVVLKGALVFTSDLIRQLDMPVRLRTVTARSYRGCATSPEELELNLSELGDLRDRDVLVIDDVLDTGRTMLALTTQLRTRSPGSLRTVVLLDKKSRREVALEADFVGMPIDDHFVVGYGLDHDGLYRNLPFIAALPNPEP